MTTETEEDKMTWWDRRHELDARLEHSVGLVEDSWFSQWKGLLLGEHESKEFAALLASHTREAQVSDAFPTIQRWLHSCTHTSSLIRVRL